MGEPIFDQAAEAGVIASLLYNPELQLSSDFLKPSYFYDSASGSIYYAIRELFNRGQSVDSYTISREIATNPSISRTFSDLNMPSIDELKELGNVLARKNTNDYIEIAKSVTANAYKRDLVKRLEGVIRSCQDQKTTIEDISTSLYSSIDELAKQYIVEEDVSLFGDKVDELWDDIEKDRERDKNNMATWKWSVLDECCPLEPSELYVFSGRRKAGKSVLMLNETMHLIKHDIPVLYVDSEMSDRRFFLRVLSYLTGVDGQSIKSGEYSDKDAEKILQAKAWLRTKKLWHIYMPDANASKLYNLCRTLRDRDGLQVLVYDYIKGRETKDEKLYSILGNLTDIIKNSICGKLNLIGITCCQQNRQFEVADSDMIERYCSTSIAFAPKTREMFENDGGAEFGNCYMVVRANRLGEQHDASDPDDHFDFTFNGNSMRIEQARQHSKQEVF